MSYRDTFGLRTSLLATALAAALLIPFGSASAADPTPQQQALRDIYRELMEINTTDSAGDTVKAAEAMAARIKAAGLPAEDVRVISTGPRKGNLVARLRGTGARKPILLLGHLDVVEAKREDWDFDPFKLQEVNGFFRGRGAIDDKAMASIFVANLIEYIKESFKPDRDIIVALTADEEHPDSPHLGAKYLVDHHRDLIDAELAINEGGGGALKDGKPLRNSIQVAEKIFATYQFEGKDPGGHSSVPRRDNPIYHLADALGRIGRHDFPVKLNAVTKAFFERVAPIEEKSVGDAMRALLAGRTDAASLEPLSSRAIYNAQIRTTCVATMLDAGHAENALPQTVRATVNCRIMPDESVEEVERTLVQLINDPKIAFRRLTDDVVLSPPSPLDPAVLNVAEQLTHEMWPGVPLIPVMSTGATDSRFLRNIGIPSYGISGLFSDPANNGVHGLNEQVGIKELYDSREFLYRLVKRLAAPSQFSQR